MKIGHTRLIKRKIYFEKAALGTKRKRSLIAAFSKLLKYFVFQFYGAQYSILWYMIETGADI